MRRNLVGLALVMTMLVVESQLFAQNSPPPTRSISTTQQPAAGNPRKTPFIFQVGGGEKTDTCNVKIRKIASYGSGGTLTYDDKFPAAIVGLSAQYGGMPGMTPIYKYHEGKNGDLLTASGLYEAAFRLYLPSNATQEIPIGKSFLSP